MSRPSTRVIMHADMDAFYASVVTRDRPELARTPVVVGGGGRSVVLSANYPARTFGIRSAMPMSRARRLCPDAVVLPPAYDEFEQVSSSVMEIFRRITPLVQTVSLDEAFLDVTGALSHYGLDPAQLAEQVRARVVDEQRITCSVGVAGSISVAKLASRRAKPDGVLVVPPDRATAFLHPLDVGELWGVGERTRAELHRLGLRTVADLAHTPRTTLRRAFGPATGDRLHELAWGLDRTEVVPRRGDHEPERSMGAEHTFDRDTDDARLCRRELLRLSTRVAARMRRSGVAGRTVTLRVRFADFTTITRSRTLSEATDVTAEVYRQAGALFDRLGLQRARLRLVGVRVSGLVPREQVQHQLVLGAREHGWRDADRAVDRAASRFGGDAVHPASLLG